jgi:hypothetical protein
VEVAVQVAEEQTITTLVELALAERVRQVKEIKAEMAMEVFILPGLVVQEVVVQEQQEQIWAAMELLQLLAELAHKVQYLELLLITQAVAVEQQVQDLWLVA